MRMRLRIVWFVTVCAVTLSGLAQKQVKVDLNTGALDAPVPFDEVFRLIGSADNSANKVTLVYGIVGKERCKAQIQRLDACPPSSSLSDSTTLIWNRVTPGTASFAFMIDKLEPDTCYEFRLTQELLPLSDDDRKKVREPLSKEFRTALEAKFKDGTLTKEELGTIQTSLNTLAKDTLKSQFLVCLSVDPVNLFDPAAEKARDAVLMLNAAYKDAKTNVGNRRTEVLRGLCLEAPCTPSTMTFARDFRSELGKLLEDPSVLTTESLAMWKAALNPAREAHKTLTMAQVARALAGASHDTLKSLVHGSVKFVGPELAASENPDPQVVALFADFLDNYTSPAFQRKVGDTPVVAPKTAASVRAEVPLRLLANSMVLEASSKKEFEGSQLPDILANQVLSRGYSLSVTPTVITEGKNFQIGVDAGIAYAFELDKPFVYVGANLYVIPINKEERHVPYWGTEGLKKRGSFILGLATTVDGTNNLVGPGSPMAGVGYRFSRYAKICTGYLVFKQKDENPLIDHDHIKANPFIALSIDTDLKTLLGGVGKLFGN